jgi:hypothetical protein
MLCLNEKNNDPSAGEKAYQGLSKIYPHFLHRLFGQVVPILFQSFFLSFPFSQRFLQFETTTATTPEEIKKLGQAGWIKYDEITINGAQMHFYKKPKRFSKYA